MKTEPWWTCSKCGRPLYRVGKGKYPDLWEQHRKVCDPLAGGRIQQWTQSDLRKERKKP